MKRLYILLLTLFCALSATAADSLKVAPEVITPDTFLPPQPKSAKDSKVKLLYNVDFLFFFDNREYDRCPYQRSQTLLERVSHQR